ncbi:toprim domain-containing protein [Variovorax sp. UC122_21]|uniref:toprim domain-containing protein n=1 Tax=Variovorax sp. UC122_21 TaxID=3374554 RepID=UPI003757C51A
MDNLNAVLRQMEAFGIELRRPPGLDDVARIQAMKEGKRTTIGKGGKAWFKFYIFRPRSGGSFITGSFGSYKHGGSWEKVDNHFAPLDAGERERERQERAEAIRRAAAERADEIANARADAAIHWRAGKREGQSPYLERKGVQGESCRYLARQLVLRWPARDSRQPDTVVRLPEGTLMLPLIRYDLPREEALRGLQFIRPDGQKVYLRGFDKQGAALRLGTVEDDTQLLLVVEGYATGLTVRMALDHRLPVFVAFDAGNLAHVVPLLRELHPDVRILICADDDWKTVDQRTQRLNNPGRTAARAIARQVTGVDMVYPVFDNTRRGEKDTDFDDLRTREGLEVARRQLEGAVQMMERVHG